MLTFLSLITQSFEKILLLTSVLLGFGFLVTIHEFGHFLFAKLFGIATPTFSIGMGPKILQKRVFDTDFCLSLLPVGGYVEIATKPEPGALILPPEAYFNNKRYWQKLLVMLGGILFNLASAFAIYFFVFMHGKPELQVESIIISNVIENSASAKAGLQKNDIILNINNTELASLKHFSLTTILPSEAKTIPVIIQREGQQKKLSLELPAPNISPRLGIQYSPHQFKLTETKLGFTEAIREGFKSTKENALATYLAIKNMFVSRSLKNAGGPVMIFSESFKMAQQGFKALLLFLAFISINLALINFLPLGALDGGQIFFVTLEWIIQRELPELFKVGINLASFALFVGLALYLTFYDVLRIFFS